MMLHILVAIILLMWQPVELHWFCLGCYVHQRKTASSPSGPETLCDAQREYLRRLPQDFDILEKALKNACIKQNPKFVPWGD